MVSIWYNHLSIKLIDYLSLLNIDFAISQKKTIIVIHVTSELQSTYYNKAVGKRIYISALFLR